MKFLILPQIYCETSITDQYFNYNHSYIPYLSYSYFPHDIFNFDINKYSLSSYILEKPTEFDVLPSTDIISLLFNHIESIHSTLPDYSFAIIFSFSFSKHRLTIYYFPTFSCTSCNRFIDLNGFDSIEFVDHPYLYSYQSSPLLGFYLGYDHVRLIQLLSPRLVICPVPFFSS